MKPLHKVQWTVAGRNLEGRVVYVVTANRKAAYTAFNTLTHGYIACDGREVERQGTIDAELERLIDTARLISGSKINARKQAAKNRRRR